MAGDYYDCLLWKETKGGKKFAVRLGAAKKRDDGGFNVYLDALPPSGEFSIVPQRQKQAAARGEPTQYEREEAIPF